MGHSKSGLLNELVEKKNADASRMSPLRSGFRPGLMGLPEMVQAASSSLFGPFSVGDFRSYDGTLWLDKSAALLNASDSCVQTRGFMPCTTSTVGNLFLIMVYDYLMFLAATCLLPGIELLLASLDPIRVSGLLFPLLSAIPDAMLVCVPRISGSIETA